MSGDMHMQERLLQEAGEAAVNALYETDDCACETCVTREVLTACWPLMLEMARSEVGTSVRVHDHFVPPSDALACKDIEPEHVPRDPRTFQ